MKKAIALIVALMFMTSAGASFASTVQSTAVAKTPVVTKATTSKTKTVGKKQIKARKHSLKKCCPTKK